MKKDNQLLQKRNEQINRNYYEMDIEGYRHNVIIEKLSQKYFLKGRTIYAIVSGEYEKRKKKTERIEIQTVTITIQAVKS